MRFPWLIAAFLLLPFSGCEGRATTDTLPWSCNETCNSCPQTPEPAGLAGFWRFDDSALEGVWQSADGSALNWFDCDERGGEWVAGNLSGHVCGNERLGGLGGSLRLQSNGYVEAGLPKDLEQGSLTLTAWVSLLRSTGQRITVVSVVRPSCQSAWLSLETADSLHRVILSVEKPVSGSDECVVEERTANLPSGFFDWGLGNWYHVAAVVDSGDEHALFVDGSPAKMSAATRHTSTPATRGIVAIGADPTGTEAFSGYIDDVALFSRALTSDELETFVTESTSVRSDGQYWTAWSASGSTASWKNDCRLPDLEESHEGAAVMVQNGYWSAGGVSTRVSTGHKINRLKKVTLVADIPDEEGFDFSLGSAHNAERCTWHASGTGKNRYEFSLDDVKHCDCPSSCDCSFPVEEARIGSRWDENGALEFSVCRVEFEWEPVDQDDIDGLTLGPGGMRGLNDWCWRPISYHEGASVHLDAERTNQEQTVGTLGGGNRETAYLAADFAEGAPGDAYQLCDLSKADHITLQADMPNGFAYQLRLADYNGIGLEWSRSWAPDPDHPEETFKLCDAEVTGDAKCGRGDDPIPHKGRSADLRQIRYLGIQKSFELTSGEATITIKSIDFGDDPVSGNCAISTSTGGAGPE